MKPFSRLKGLKDSEIGKRIINHQGLLNKSNILYWTGSSPDYARTKKFYGTEYWNQAEEVVRLMSEVISEGNT